MKTQKQLGRSSALNLNLERMNLGKVNPIDSKMRFNEPKISKYVSKPLQSKVIAKLLVYF